VDTENLLGIRLAPKRNSSDICGENHKKYWSHDWSSAVDVKAADSSALCSRNRPRVRATSCDRGIELAEQLSCQNIYVEFSAYYYNYRIIIVYMVDGQDGVGAEMDGVLRGLFTRSTEFVQGSSHSRLNPNSNCCAQIHGIDLFRSSVHCGAECRTVPD